MKKSTKEQMESLVSEILYPSAQISEREWYDRNFKLTNKELIPLIGEAPLVYFQIIEALREKKEVPLDRSRGSAGYFLMMAAVKGLPIWRVKQLSQILLWPEVYNRQDFSVLDALVSRLTDIRAKCAASHLRECEELIKFSPITLEKNGLLRPGAKRMIAGIRRAIVACGGLENFRVRPEEFLWQSAGQ